MTVVGRPGILPVSSLDVPFTLPIDYHVLRSGIHPITTDSSYLPPLRTLAIIPGSLCRFGSDRRWTMEDYCRGLVLLYSWRSRTLVSFIAGLVRFGPVHSVCVTVSHLLVWNPSTDVL